MLQDNTGGGVMMSRFKEREVSSVPGYSNKYLARSAEVNVMGVHRVQSLDDIGREDLPSNTSRSTMAARILTPNESDLRINHHRRNGQKALPSNMFVQVWAAFMASKRIPVVDNDWFLPELKARLS